VPWVSPDLVDDLNVAVGKRWRELDPMLPAPGDLPDGCMAPLVVTGSDGRPAGVGVCRHRQVPDNALDQVWGTVGRFHLTPVLPEPDTFAALDALLGQWRDHLAAVPEASGEDSAAMINWPSRDVSGIKALLHHGMQPFAVLAVRPAGRPGVSHDIPPGVVIREADADDLDAVTELEMGVIRYDAQFGVAIMRPATETLVQEDTHRALTGRPDWVWVAERDSRIVGLVNVQPPEDSAWITVMTRPGPTVYLQTMFVRPDERGGGLGAALVKRAHDEVDARGISTTLLHHAQMNPLSAPFWNRMGYRPLWTDWERRPASALG
jgi:GNAT superfamily N-acetyltransferase